MTGDLEHRQFALQLAERRSWSRHPNRRTRRLPTAAAERPAEPFIREAQGQPPTITEQRVPGIPSSSMPVHKGRMLGPFDWCTVIGIGIAAGILGIVLLIGWRQGAPRA